MDQANCRVASLVPHRWHGRADLCRVSPTVAPDRPAAASFGTAVADRVQALVERELAIIGQYGTALLEGSDTNRFDTEQGAQRIVGLLTRLGFTAGAILARELAAILTHETAGPGEGIKIAGLLEDVRAALAVASTEAFVIDPDAPRVLLVGSGSATLDTVAWVAMRQGLECYEVAFSAAPEDFGVDVDAVVVVGVGAGQLPLLRALRERHPEGAFVGLGGDTTLLEVVCHTVLALDAEPTAVVAEVRQLVVEQRTPISLAIVGERNEELAAGLAQRGFAATTIVSARAAATAAARTNDCLVVGADIDEDDAAPVARSYRADPGARRTVLVRLGDRDHTDALRVGYDVVLPADVSADLLALQVRALVAHRRDHRFEVTRGHVLGGHAAAIVLERMLVSAHRDDRTVAICLIELTPEGIAHLDEAQEELAIEFRSGDIVARWDNDHLLIALRGVPRRTAVARLHGSLDRFGLLSCGCRGAVAEFPFDATSHPALLQVARASIASSREHDGPEVVGSDWSPDATKGADVVIVDNDHALARVIAAHLEERGLTTKTFDTGVAALGWLQNSERSAPRLVLLDLNLGGMDGLQVLRKLRASGAMSRFRLLVVTATSREDDLREAFRLGAWDVVSKPFSFAVLDNRITRGLGV